MLYFATWLKDCHTVSSIIVVNVLSCLVLHLVFCAVLFISQLSLYLHLQVKHIHISLSLYSLHVIWFLLFFLIIHPPNPCQHNLLSIIQIHRCIGIYTDMLNSVFIILLFKKNIDRKENRHRCWPCSMHHCICSRVNTTESFITLCKQIYTSLQIS